MDWGLFYPGKGGSPLQAKAVCAACPVRSDCLEDALAHMDVYGPGLHGVWGGTTRRERDRIRREREKHQLDSEDPDLDSPQRRAA